MSKRLMIIVYYWPPASSPGVQRWVKFVKYLARKDYDITVVTTDNGSYPSKDLSLFQDVPDNLDIKYTKSFEPILLYNLLQGKKTRKVPVGFSDLKQPTSLYKRLAKLIRAEIFIPDAKIGWYFRNRRKILKWVKKQDIEVVITSGPPHSTHLFGKYLKKKAEISWIADFRDPWSKIYYEEYLNRSKRAVSKNEALEKETLDAADHVLVVSEKMKEEFGSNSNNVSIIPNGFDPEDFVEKPPVRQNDKFILLYAGNLKENQDVTALYAALRELKGKNKQFAKSFEWKIIGNLHKEVRASIEKYALTDLVSIHDFVPHETIVQEIQNAHLLYLPIPKAENNKSIITGKIFEYLASRNPILGIGPTQGDAALILDNAGHYPMLDYNDQESIKQLIKHYFSVWIADPSHSFTIKSDQYKKYDREILTGRLMEVIENV